MGERNVSDSVYQYPYNNLRAGQRKGLYTILSHCILPVVQVIAERNKGQWLHRSDFRKSGNSSV
jgi:hypothetical protein